MVDLSVFSVEELDILVEQIKEEKRARREAAKEQSVANREIREAEAFNRAVAGQNIYFLFGKQNDVMEGTVLKVNKASITVEFSLSGETVKRYVKGHRILGDTASGWGDSNDSEEVSEAV